MAYRLPRVQIVPQPDDQVAFEADGKERLRWHASSRYPRPFFFPVVGPSGVALTRMGHPAAPDHDHHRSLWWGHANVGGVNFWEERGGAQQVRQEAWVHYQDGDNQAGMVVRIGWFDAHKARLLQQELIAVLLPMDQGEALIEVQTAFTSAVEGLKLGKTNFGFLGLRVAASLSALYGNGRLTNSAGEVGEARCFGKQALWMDYSGPVRDDQTEGITWFDHPTNPNHPTSWHVRDDGWMSAAFCLREAYPLARDKPLRLRYGFLVHGGAADRARNTRLGRSFSDSPAWEVVKAEAPWRVRLQRAR